MTDKNNTNPQSQQIELNDIAILVSAVDIASKAGAFEGQLMATIGLARNKMNDILVEHQKNVAEQQENSNDKILLMEFRTT